jgi:hypothetical protein
MIIRAPPMTHANDRDGQPRESDRQSMPCHPTTERVHWLSKECEVGVSIIAIPDAKGRYLSGPFQRAARNKAAMIKDPEIKDRRIAFRNGYDDAQFVGALAGKGAGRD